MELLVWKKRGRLQAPREKDTGRYLFPQFDTCKNVSLILLPFLPSQPCPPRAKCILRSGEIAPALCSSNRDQRTGNVELFYIYFSLGVHLFGYMAHRVLFLRY